MVVVYIVCCTEVDRAQKGKKQKSLENVNEINDNNNAYDGNKPNVYVKKYVLYEC